MAAEFDLEADLKDSNDIRAYVDSLEAANDLYAALCNRPWRHKDGGEIWACTWRYAGGLVAEMRGKGDYMSHYCSGNEGHVAEEIASMLHDLGWSPLSDKEAEGYFDG